MASKLDDTLAELRLIRERQEQVLEQQEKIRLNAEKAQLQREAQEQKAKARQKALAEKALKKYSNKSAYQAPAAATAQSQTELPAIGTATSADAVSSNAALSDYSTMTRSDDHGMSSTSIQSAEPTIMTGPFFTSARPQVGIDRSAQMGLGRRTGIRGPTQSPMPSESMSSTISRNALSSLGQTLPGASGSGLASTTTSRSPSPVFSPGKLQSALQKTLGQLPKA